MHLRDGLNAAGPSNEGTSFERQNASE